MSQLILPDKRHWDEILRKSQDYAKKSLPYTEDYEGWEDGHEKEKRITRGRFGQEWLAIVCQLNGIHFDLQRFEQDRADVMHTDAYDIEIIGYRVDVKAGLPDYAFQVSPGCLKSRCAMYCFLQLSKDWTLKPSGLIPYDYFWEDAQHIKYEEIIPGTQARQRFQAGSFFLFNHVRLIPFEKQMLAFQQYTRQGRNDRFIQTLERIEGTLNQCSEEIFRAREERVYEKLEEIYIMFKSWINEEMNRESRHVAEHHRQERNILNALTHQIEQLWKKLRRKVKD